LKRVFDVDIEHCPRCGEQLKLFKGIEEKDVIQRILPHLGLGAQPRAPAKQVGPFLACLRSESGLFVERVGGSVRTALGQSLRWRGAEARRVRKLSAKLSEAWVLGSSELVQRSTMTGYIQDS